jgi:hypothetical protein
MNKVGNKIFSVVMLLLALLWCAIVLLFIHHDDAGFYYWGGFGFGLLAFLVSAGVYWLVGDKADKNTAEITLIPDFISIIYVIFSVVFNLFFIYQKDGESRGLLITVNLLALLVYAVIICYLMIYASRVSAQAAKINDKAEQIRQIKTELAAAIGMCKDTEIKSGLQELKQKVDYSDNLSQKITAQEEKLFEEQIKKIEKLLNDGADKEDILSEIAEAERIWIVRNSKLMMNR